MFGSKTNIFDTLLINISPQYRDQCKNLLSSMLQIDPSKRITAQQLVQHPIFDEFREPTDGHLIEPYIPYDYASDQRAILKILIKWAQDLYSTSRAELLFLAIDIFNRVSSFYKDRTPLDRMTLAATCLWVASKLTTSLIIPLDVYVPGINKIVSSVTNNGILDTEIEIIHLQNGIIHVSKLYRECTTVNELIHSFQHVILDQDSTLYARVDIPNWIKTIQTLPIISEQPDKNITISELLLS